MKFVLPPKQTTIFCMALCIFAGVMSLAQPVPESSFCAADEKTVAVCLRNWVNAAGNLLTVLVAIAAATFAFRQWQAADQQVASALIPALERRLSQIASLNDIIRSIRIKVAFIFISATSILRVDKDASNLDELLRHSHDIVRSLREIDILRGTLGEQGSDINIYSDIVKVCRTANEICEIYDDPDILELINKSSDVSGHRDTLGREKALRRLVENTGGLMAASQELERRQELLLEQEVRLLKLAVAVHDQRLVALKLPPSV